MGIEHLYRDVTLPPMARVRRTFQVDTVPDVAAEVDAQMEGAGLVGRLTPGGAVAIGVGSRGIAHLPLIVARVVHWFRDHGMVPFIFPAMGSHGGATSDGQAAMLETLGITETAVGCPVRSQIEATRIGTYRTSVGKDLGVYFDSNAVAADAVFVISRTKPHPGFVARHESGTAKMLTIGCGKHIAAETYHRLGFAHFPEIMAGVAEQIVQTMPSLLGVLAIVENAVHDTARIDCAVRGDMLARDAELLHYARACLPSLPVNPLHALIVDRMGKNIAGPGMDPNITGRYLTERSGPIDVRGLAVLDLTPQTGGNANGMGAADFITRRMYERIDVETTYLNALTDPATIRYATVPPVMLDDRGAMSMALKKGNTFDDPPRMVRIRDTLTLDRFLASPAVIDALADDAAFTVLDDPHPIVFDAAGNVAGPEFWDAF